MMSSIAFRLLPAARMIPPFGHEKIAGSVIFLQEPDVRAHVRVDLAQVGLVDEFDDEHSGIL
jgi:hypothetical protein